MRPPRTACLTGLSVVSSLGLSCADEPLPLVDGAAAAQCAASVTPSTMNFGVLIGPTARFVELTNPTEIACSYVIDYPVEPGFGVEGPTRLTLDPGETEQIRVTVSPDLLGDCASGCTVMQVRSENSAEVSAELEVSYLRSSRSELLILPERLTLADVRVGEVAMRTLTFYNTGTRALAPAASSPMATPELPSGLELIGALPSTLEPGETASLQVRFQPSEPRAETTTELTFTFSDLEGGTTSAIVSLVTGALP